MPSIQLQEQDNIDRANRNAFNSIFGESIVGHKIADINIQFQYNIATKDVTSTVANSATVTQANSTAVISSGTNAAGSAELESVDVLRYRAGHEGFAFFTAAFTTGVADSHQYAGIYSDDDGFLIGYDGVNFSAGFRKATSDTFTTQANFSLDNLDGNGDSGFTLDPTKLNIYRISFGWLGVAPVTFEVFAGVKNGWIPFHQIEFHNLQTTTSINNPVLPVKMEAVNSGNTTDLVVKTGSWSAGIVNGAKNPAGRHFATDNSKSVGVSTLTNILTLKNVITFQSKTNRVKVLLKSVSGATEGNKPVVVRLLKDATLGGTPSYSNIDATNSVIQLDTAGTTVTGGTLELPLAMAKADSLFEKVEELEITILPGETLTIAAISSNANDVTNSVRWEELF